MRRKSSQSEKPEGPQKAHLLPYQIKIKERNKETPEEEEEEEEEEASVDYGHGDLRENRREPEGNAGGGGTTSSLGQIQGSRVLQSDGEDGPWVSCKGLLHLSLPLSLKRLAPGALPLVSCVVASHGECRPLLLHVCFFRICFVNISPIIIAHC
jgi:hypothetical protein